MAAKFSALHLALRADYKAAQKACGLSARRVSVAFGHSPDSSWPYQVMEGDLSFPVEQLPIWIQITGGEQVLRYLARLGGFELVETDPPDPAEVSIARAGQTANQLIATAFRAVEDGTVDEDELAAVEAAAEEAQAQITRLRRAIAYRHRHGVVPERLRDAG